MRALRRDRHLTLDELSRRSGVSRRMITMLEAGETNASLGTLDKLARALGCAFADLVAEAPTPPLTPERAETHQPLWQDGQGSSARLLAARSTVVAAELWLWELVAGAGYEAEADPGGSEEILFVRSGRLAVRGASYERTVDAGQFLRLPSDAPYGYRNPARKTVQFLRLLLVP